MMGNQWGADGKFYSDTFTIKGFQESAIDADPSTAATVPFFDATNILDTTYMY